jgi:hypothetical protein
MQSTEHETMPDPSYMKAQKGDLTENVRAIIIDWVMNVHLKYKLLPETLFITVNLIDRYFSIQTEIKKSEV